MEGNHPRASKGKGGKKASLWLLKWTLAGEGEAALMIEARIQTKHSQFTLPQICNRNICIT